MNFPNHFWGRFPACRYVCSDDYPEGYLGRFVQGVFGGAKPDENAQKLYSNLCAYETPRDTSAMKAAAQCLNNCKEKRLKLRQAGSPIWCTFKEPACVEEIAKAKNQQFRMSYGHDRGELSADMKTKLKAKLASARTSLEKQAKKEEADKKAAA